VNNNTIDTWRCFDVPFEIDVVDEACVIEVRLEEMKKQGLA
jgi:hypothetical protein